MANILKKNFVNSDLDSNFEYTWVWTTGAGTTNVILDWYDNNNILRTTSDVFTIISATTIKISVGGPITGTHTISLLQNESASDGRRLFGLPLINTLDSDHRIPVGKNNSDLANNISYNTLTNLLITEVTDNVSQYVLIRTQNLNDLPNKTTARTNLGVYGKTESYNKTEILNNLKKWSNTYALTLTTGGTSEVTSLNIKRFVHCNRIVFLAFECGVPVANTEFHVGKIQTGYEPPYELRFPALVANTSLNDGGAIVRIQTDGQIYMKCGQDFQTIVANISFPVRSDFFPPEILPS